MTCGEQETIALCAWLWEHLGFLQSHGLDGKQESLPRDCMQNPAFGKYQVEILESNCGLESGGCSRISRG